MKKLSESSPAPSPTSTPSAQPLQTSALSEQPSQIPALSGQPIEAPAPSAQPLQPSQVLSLPGMRTEIPASSVQTLQLSTPSEKLLLPLQTINQIVNKVSAKRTSCEQVSAELMNAITKFQPDVQEYCLKETIRQFFDTIKSEPSQITIKNIDNSSSRRFHYMAYFYFNIIHSSQATYHTLISYISSLFPWTSPNPDPNCFKAFTASGDPKTCLCQITNISAIFMRMLSFDDALIKDYLISWGRSLADRSAYYESQGIFECFYTICASAIRRIDPISLKGITELVRAKQAFAPEQVKRTAAHPYWCRLNSILDAFYHSGAYDGPLPEEFKLNDG